MMFTSTQWAAIAELKKNETGKCELCKIAHDPCELICLNLSHDGSYDIKGMLILCPECYKRIIGSMENEKKQLIALNEKFRTDISTLDEKVDSNTDDVLLANSTNKSLTMYKLVSKYIENRWDIIGNAIAAAVLTYKLSKRPTFDCLFTHPCIDERGILDFCKSVCNFSICEYARVASEKIAALREAGSEGRAKSED